MSFAGSDSFDRNSSDRKRDDKRGFTRDKRGERGRFHKDRQGFAGRPSFKHSRRDGQDAGSYDRSFDRRDNQRDGHRDYHKDDRRDGGRSFERGRRPDAGRFSRSSDRFDRSDRSDRFKKDDGRQDRDQRFDSRGSRFGDREGGNDRFDHSSEHSFEHRSEDRFHKGNDRFHKRFDDRSGSDGWENKGERSSERRFDDRHDGNRRSFNKFHDDSFHGKPRDRSYDRHDRFQDRDWKRSGEERSDRSYDKGRFSRGAGRFEKRDGDRFERRSDRRFSDRKPRFDKRFDRRSDREFERQDDHRFDRQDEFAGSSVEASGTESTVSTESSFPSPLRTPNLDASGSANEASASSGAAAEAGSSGEGSAGEDEHRSFDGSRGESYGGSRDERQDRGQHFEGRRFDRDDRRGRGDRFDRRRDFDRDGRSHDRGYDRGGRGEGRRDFEHRDDRRGGYLSDYRDESRMDRREDRRGDRRGGRFDRFDRRPGFDGRERGRDSERSFERQDDTDRTSFDVLVLGAGASGLLCAAHLVSMGLSVALIDRSQTPGRKLSMAGGGHANFTNSHISADQYVCDTEDFVAPVLAQIGKDKILHVMDVLGLAYEEKEKGKIFLRDEAAQLVRALMRRCRRGEFAYFGGAALEADCLVFDGSDVVLRTRRGLCLTGKHAVLALGSPAMPASGSSGIGYAMAQHLGHKVILPEACLAPLFLEESSPLLGLQGVSLPVAVSLCGRTIKDDLLFTHMGISGPAILKASLFWEQGEPLTIDFLPRKDESLFDGAGAKTVVTVLSLYMPRRLAEQLVPDKALLEKRCAELSAEERESLLDAVHRCNLVPTAMAGLRQAEVCRGGVDCQEVERGTFFSKLHKQVSIIGEMLDVTGSLGGYNLHWAFASALLAAQAVADKLHPNRQKAWTDRTPDRDDQRRRPFKDGRR